MSSIDFDPSIKLCLKFLHSSASDSTEQLRLTLDDHIRQTYGSAKTLGNILPKKYLAEEKLESPRSKHKTDKSSSKTTTVPLPQQSPQQLQIPERENDDGSVMDGDLSLDLLEEDLTCAVCRQISVQAGNRLVECDGCRALYHQVILCYILAILINVTVSSCYISFYFSYNPYSMQILVNNQNFYSALLKLVIVAQMGCP